MVTENVDSNKLDKKGTAFEEQQLVIFKVAGEEFGVNINEVKEIIRWEDVTRIPNSEAYIKGVINLRGNIIVVNDLAMKLGLPSKTIDDDTRILVVEVSNNTVGMIVDSATEVMRLAGEDIREAPSMITSTIDHNYIDGVGLLDEKRLLTLLDLGKVLESKDFEKILQTQRTAEQNIHNIKDLKGNEGKKETTPVQQQNKEPEIKPLEEQPAKTLAAEEEIQETTADADADVATESEETAETSETDGKK